MTKNRNLKKIKNWKLEYEILEQKNEELNNYIKETKIRLKKQVKINENDIWL